MKTTIDIPSIDECSINVRTCKVAVCSFNSDFECSTKSITPDMKDDSINYLTFSTA